MPLHTKVGAGVFWNMSGVGPHQFQIRIAERALFAGVFEHESQSAALRIADSWG